MKRANLLGGEGKVVWNNLTIFKKGLLLIVAPLFFQLVFFGLLAEMQTSIMKAQDWSIHSKDVLRQTQVILRNLLELGTGMRGYIISADADLKKAYDLAAQRLPKDVERLSASVIDNDEQKEQVGAIAKAIGEYTKWHAETMEFAGIGRHDVALERVKSETGTKLHNGIVEAMTAFIRAEDDLDRQRTADLEATRVRQQRLLGVGAIATLLITLSLAYVFSRSIGGRLATLSANAERLQHGKALTPPLDGTDEVAQLDAAFRDMAAEIAHSQSSVIGSSEEIRTLYVQAKASEAEIRALNENLERRISERTAELARANTALREADRAKDDFLAMLAHELRNPLAPVRNALQIMKTPGIGPEPSKQAQEMIERQVGHMIRLVDDLLDVSRIMRGKIELRKSRVELGTVFARAVETAQPMLDTQGQELIISKPQEPVWLDGDLIRLSQVIGNLLVNAAKYSDKAGRVWLTGRRDGTEAVITVRDNGVGIPPELLPRIFEPFVQADRTLARSKGGLGIGLTLVKHIVAMHGGRVAVTSAGIGKGSEFKVRLPALPVIPAAAPGPLQPDAQKPGLARRVLVVDDNVDAADSAAMLLRMSGHQVEVAYNGEAALDAAQKFHPEVVLLDIGLPGLTGYEVARRLRAKPEFKAMVLAAVTGYGQEEDRRRTREAGFDAHLTKPLAPSVLTSFVSSPRSFVLPD